ncbi:MAG: TIGR03862 family flavoprotein [Arenibacterium sp.]
MTAVDALVVGGGPAGLMAAEVLSAKGLSVLVAEAKPSIGRKFLMAGKSGLNLTKAEDPATFIKAYADAAQWLQPAINAFGPDDVQNWARSLGRSLFTGSTGRVFPTEMKASPLLRAWLSRLRERDVMLRTRLKWCGWRAPGLAVFETPDGETEIRYKAMVLALGGASWPRLGSDGAWRALLDAKGIRSAPFAASNAALRIDWSAHMQRHFGAPLKNICLSCGEFHSRGEAILSRHGLEGGGIYALSRPIREGAPLFIDLVPDIGVETLAHRLSQGRPKESLSNRLRKRARLTPAQVAMVQEFARPLPTALDDLAEYLKGLRVIHRGLAPIEEAISTSGGIRRDELNSSFMLTRLPGVFCAGEMLDWDAPTGGYLLTVCFATGKAAGLGAAQWVNEDLRTSQPFVK